MVMSKLSSWLTIQNKSYTSRMCCAMCQTKTKEVCIELLLALGNVCIAVKTFSIVFKRAIINATEKASEAHVAIQLVFCHREQCV